MRDPRFSEAAVDEAAAVERYARLTARVAAASVNDWPRRRRGYLARSLAVGGLAVALGFTAWPGLIVLAVAALWVIGHPPAARWWMQGSDRELRDDRARLAQADALYDRAMTALMRMDPDRLPLDGEL